ncbi:hypothetical protein ID866_7651 [Astraeus odoratus]|nr:hypothetical protein ID866_7651 [Astraeus odoratus]
MLYNPDSHPTFPNSGSRTHDSDTNEYGLVASTDGPDAIIAPLPFGDAPIFADTADLGTVAFHQFWGCLLTPENIAAQIHTDTIRYHAWVAAKKVIERNRCGSFTLPCLHCIFLLTPHHISTPPSFVFELYF